MKKNVPLISHDGDITGLNIIRLLTVGRADGNAYQASRSLELLLAENVEVKLSDFAATPLLRVRLTDPICFHSPSSPRSFVAEIKSNLYTHEKPRSFGNLSPTPMPKHPRFTVDSKKIV